MPATDSPEIIVARWLKQNRYEETLASFLGEAGLTEDAGLSSNDALTLEQILEEKRLYDQSLQYEKRGEPTHQSWTSPAPSIPQILDVPQSSNILHVAVDQLDSSDQVLSITMADRRLMQTDPSSPVDDFEHVLTQDSPILSWISVPGPDAVQWIGTTMSGRVFLYTPNDRSPSVSRIDHKRYCVKATLDTSNPNQWLLATIGWDSKLNIYHITASTNSHGLAYISNLEEPSSSLDLQTIPEDILWITNPTPTTSHHDPNHSSSGSSSGSILLLTRRDSSLLHYYLPTRPAPTLLGVQNLAPHAISWTIFTPSSISICPTDPTLLAVATSSLPHMKLILIRIRIPSNDSSNNSEKPAENQQNVTSNDGNSFAYDPRAALAKANADEAAIVHHVSTLAPQTPYSTPKVVWRPDGSGVWVNGDDGCVRGIERATGKVVATLKGGHEAATKIRTLWAGYVDVSGKRQEWVISGGFDRRVVVWKIGKDE
ncbi:MAG: hypothetical protein GOMPHAMPRED_001188 [Gomphillus americanus]|uniref:LisH domain-containing protein n=1 Tax=Gomphillus americanus TaxID=1940652 RepID=A0A8H3FAI1_9LECA|nr:MAG: hypothetical protein GOMPHAMPRED_001188 [Gomphillus americanus]